MRGMLDRTEWVKALNTLICSCRIYLIGYFIWVHSLIRSCHQSLISNLTPINLIPANCDVIRVCLSWSVLISSPQNFYLWCALFQGVLRGADFGPLLHVLSVDLEIRVKLLLQPHKMLISARQPNVYHLELSDVRHHRRKPSEFMLWNQINKACFFVLIEKGLIVIGDEHGHSAIAGGHLDVQVTSVFPLQLILVYVQLIDLESIIEIWDMAADRRTNL